MNDPQPPDFYDEPGARSGEVFSWKTDPYSNELIANDVNGEHRTSFDGSLSIDELTKLSVISKDVNEFFSRVNARCSGEMRPNDVSD